MRLLIFLICFILLNTHSYSQNTFEKIIDTLGCGIATCIQETFDGGFVFSGTSNYGGNDVIIVKMDSTGTIEWAKIYGGPSMEGASYIEQTSDSGYMVNAMYDGGGLNAKSWLLRLDASGDTLWTQTFSAGPGSTIISSVNSMASINSTVYGMTGYFKPQPLTFINAYFISSIGNGIQLGNKIYNYSAFGTEAYAINKTFDGGFIISSAFGTGSSASDFYLIRTNAIGDTIWTRTYDNSQNDAGKAVQQTADSGFIVAGYTRYLINAYNIYLIKTDAVGDTLWTKQYVDSVNGGANSIQQTLDGGYIIAGVRLGEMYIIKTNSWGDTLWTRTFGNMQNGSQAFNVRQTQDGGYIISGTGTIGSTSGAYIIKTDSLGIVSSGTGFAEVNNPFVFDVYPNPPSDILNIRVNGVSSRNSSLTIYNMSGQPIYNFGIRNNATLQVDLTGMPNGLYAFILRSGINTFTKKVILHK